MKPIKWTPDIIKKLSSLYKNPSDLKKANPSAYKAMRRYNLNEILYPLTDRIRNETFTSDKLIELMKTCTSRSDFQLKHGSAYNAARKLGIITLVFPNSKQYDLFKRLPYTDEELISMSRKFNTILEWEKAHSGSYQVACRRGIIEKYGPRPTQGTSQPEQELLAYLKTLVLDFKTKRFGNDYEIDCYSELLNLGVEYNGFYWHSEEKKGIQYHLKKTKYFEEKGIRIIHIWENEWRDRKEQVKSYLRSACKINTHRLGARKCEFKEIDKATTKAFLEETHIQGAPNNVKYAIGCFFNHELIGVASFGLHHRNVKQVVLNRFACKADYTIAGFLAKACKSAKLHFNCELYSWADYSKSQAKGYIAAGWTLIKYNSADYFYVNKEYKVISKQSRQKKNIGTPTHVTESEHAKQDGLIRVWDCGKILLKFSA